MKKRLLSAALALAMVLTLLPMSAFAATTYTVVSASSGTAVTEAAKNPIGKSFTYQSSTDYSNNITKTAGKWYWNAPADAAGNIIVYEADTGFIQGVSTSGAWYPDGPAYERAVTGTTAPGSLTLLGSAPAFTRPWPTTLSIDLNGNNFSIANLNACGTDGASAMTSITVTDKLYPTRGGARASITIPATSRTPYDTKLTGAVTLNATNVDVGVINLSGRRNSVTLDNCAATSITMNGETVTNTAGAKTWDSQQLTIKNKSSITSLISIIGDSSTVSLQDTIGAPAVTVEGNAGTLTVGGYSTIGAITVRNNTQVGATANGNIPTVTVNGGTVAGINTTGANTTASSSFTINRTNNDINISGPISTAKGSVSVTNARTGNITVPIGSVTIAGSNNSIGELKLAGSDTTTLSITATDSTFTKITGDNTLTISQWPTGRVNNYGELALGNYKGKGVKGGVFNDVTGTALGKFANLDWVDNANLQFIVPIKGSTNVALYGKDELTEAISSIAEQAPADPGKPIIVLGQGEATNTGTIQLNFGGNPWAYIKHNATTGIKLPTRINNTGISKWIVKNGTPGTDTGSSFAAGVTENIPVGNVILDSTNTSAEVSKITGVRGSNNGTVNNADVRVRLNGNTIELSGAVVAGAGGIASIQVDLTTDYVGTNGQTVVIPNVTIDYDVNTRKVSFNAIQPSLAAYGVIVQDGALVLNRGTGAKYTVTANLSVSASDLGLASPAAGEQIVVTVGGKLSGWSAEAKQQLIDDIQTDGTFSYAGNKAMLEAINAAQATITSNNSVSGWIASTKDYIWKNGSPVGSTLGLGKHTGNFKDFLTVGSAAGDVGKINDNYSNAYIVPYLVVNVTDYSASGTLTATMTPYYRVDVSAAVYKAADAHTVQTGRALSALTGDMSTPITVNLGLGGNFNNAYAHQDDTYVYQAAGGTNSIYHAGKSGLGTIQINNTDGMISIESDIAGRNLIPVKYNSLQAAVDDTVPGVTQANTSSGAQVTETMDTIIVDGNYKGSCDFTMTGYARKIKVIALGDLPIKCTSQNVDVQNPSGYTYIFQLKNDTAPTGGNITIVSATGGSARVSANPAKAGERVTITLSPATGYTAAGVTVRDANNQAVTVTGSGTSYSFVMPSGKVTVTPSFNKVQQSNATVTVSNPSIGGTAATTAGNSQVAPGTPVTVTVSPSTGYRTMGVYVTNATATRTGANTFSFNVPSGTTSVVVTPRFDRTNGTLFEDVWSYDYFSNAVAWAVGRGITNGDGSVYRFGTGKSCTREDMVTFLWRNAGSPVVTGVSNPFWDVQVGSYYYNAVMWAIKNGITKGVSANQFGVGRAVTRGEAVTFLYRAAGEPAASTNSGFYDVPSSQYYAKAVAWASANGVTNGTSATLFSPNSYCMREQIVTFMYRNATGTRA